MILKRKKWLWCGLFVVGSMAACSNGDETRTPVSVQAVDMGPSGMGSVDMEPVAPDSRAISPQCEHPRVSKLSVP